MISPLKERKKGNGAVRSDRAERRINVIGGFPLLGKLIPLMDGIVTFAEGVNDLLKGLNPSKALVPDEHHNKALEELAMVLDTLFAHLFQ